MIKQVMGEIDKYFEYLTDVIGIKSILIDPNQVQSQPIPLLIRVENLNHFSTDASELLEKMITALQLDKSFLKVVDFNTNHSNLQPKYILSFVSNPNEFTVKNEIETFAYSPEVLLKSPQFKKAAWEQMQKVVALVKQK